MLDISRVLRHPDLARGAFISLTVQGGGLALGYGTQVLLARWLGESAFGVYSLVVGWATVLGLVAALGWPDTLIRFLPVSDRRHRTGLLRLSLASAAVAGLIATGVGLLVHPSTEPLKSAFSVGLWVIPVIAVGHLLTARARTLGRPVIALAPNSIVRPVGTLLAVGAASLVLALNGTVAVTAFVIAISVGVLWQALSEPMDLRLPEFDVKRWIRVATPIWVFSVLSLATERADLLIVAAYLPIEDVAAYGAAAATATVVLLFLIAAEVLAGPRFAAARDRVELQGLVRETTRLGFFPAVMLVILYVLFGRQILSLFGQSFQRVYGVLLILSIGRLISAAFGSVVLVLNTTGHQDDNLKAFGLVAPAGVLASLLLVPRFGLIGAALVTSGTMVTWNVWLHLVVRRRLGISTLPFSLGPG